MEELQIYKTPRTVAKLMVQESWLRPPPLSGSFLTFLALSHLDPEVRGHSSLADIVAFINLHFPYYGGPRQGQCERVVAKVLGSLEKEVSDTWQQQEDEDHLQAAYQQLMELATDEDQQMLVAMSLRQPLFLEAMMAGLYDYCHQDELPARGTKPPPQPFTDRQLAMLALVHLRGYPATLAELTIYLSHLFPSFWASGRRAAFTSALWSDHFLTAVASIALESMCTSSQVRFQLIEECAQQVQAELARVAREQLPQLMAAIWDASCLPVLFPDLADICHSLRQSGYSLPIPRHPLTQEMLLFCLLLQEKNRTGGRTSLQQLASQISHLTRSQPAPASLLLDQLAAFVERSEAFELEITADGSHHVAILPAALLFGEQLLATNLVYNLKEVGRKVLHTAFVPFQRPNLEFWPHCPPI
ncbi:MAG: hypothetical protein FJ333_08305 [Sphingomonadales bacterium]|nr:hypothetical protein [Sphingomonadales bacterium]